MDWGSAQLACVLPRSKLRPCTRNKLSLCFLLSFQVFLWHQATSTPTQVFLKTQIFLCVCTFRSHVNDIFGHWKRRFFLKTPARVEIFENSVFAFTCGRGKWRKRSVKGVRLFNVTLCARLLFWWNEFLLVMRESWTNRSILENHFTDSWIMIHKRNWLTDSSLLLLAN